MPNNLITPPGPNTASGLGQQPLAGAERDNRDNGAMPVPSKEHAGLSTEKAVASTRESSPSPLPLSTDHSCEPDSLPLQNSDGGAQERERLVAPASAHPDSGAAAAVDQQADALEETGRTSQVPGTQKPQIIVNDRQPREVVGDAWHALGGVNDPPTYFRWDNRLVQLRKVNGALQIEEINGKLLRSRLITVADWVKKRGAGIKHTWPPEPVLSTMLAEPDDKLPELSKVAHSPVFSGGGELLDTPGYHPNEKLWLELPTDLQSLQVPDNPTTQEIDAAKQLILEDLLCDFPFVAKADQAHAVAALVLPFVRHMINGCTPLHLLEASGPGAGKGLLAKLISLVATGRPVASKVLPKSDDEVRKQITADLLRAPTVILLDNVDHKVASPALAAALTAETWEGRILGHSRMQTVANQALWMLTGNNPQLSLEMARRCVRCRLEPAEPRPWLKQDFKHPDILEWAAKERPQLVRAVLVLVQAWIAHGKPSHSERLGSCESWSKVVGGILDVAGVPGFLANREQLYEDADEKRQELGTFFETWWDKYRGKPQRAATLNDLCEQYDLLRTLRGDGKPRSRETKLGNTLKKEKGKVFKNLRLDKATPPDKRAGSTYYQLVPVTDKRKRSSGTVPEETAEP
jgi:hypothetical protein